MKPLDLIRARPAWLIPTLAGLLVVGVLVYQQRSLEQLAESIQQCSTATQAEFLDERLSALEHFKSEEQKWPQTVTPEQLSELRNALEQRLATQEAQITERASTNELQAVRDAVATLGDSIQKLEIEKPPKQPAKHPSFKSLATAPPFKLLGIEVRGGHRFVAVSPLGNAALEHIQLLRVGDQYQGWQLESLEPQAAVFQVNAQTRRLDVRQR
ncbi:hypothetical protein ACIPZ8_14805 [Pseudomonas sp. NPDC089422]|uniref:hypothetical protein n=1 Tax=Pseudomonas sp. NPDC089422 TaxID=3364466 RepID=UPI003800B302